MRIICDHCDRPISGSVRRTPESLNFHADCLAELAEEAKEDTTAASWSSQEEPVNSWREWDRRQ